MTLDREPPRLLLDDATDPFVRAVLATNADDKPAAASVARAPAAIAALIATQTATLAAAASTAVGASVAAPAAGAALASTSVPAVSFGLVVKWVGVGVLLGTTTAVTVEGARSATNERTPSASSRALTRTAPSVGAARRGPPSSASARTEAVMAVEPPRSEPSTKAPEHGDIEREVALLDRAHAALASSDPERALDALAEARRLPAPALAPEATVLRVRALLMANRVAEAERVARELLRSAPDSPQSTIVRELVRFR